jgi:hypothetical protein
MSGTGRRREAGVEDTKASTTASHAKADEVKPVNFDQILDPDLWQNTGATTRT